MQLSTTSPTNGLLAALPAAERGQLLSRSAVVQLRHAQMLYEVGEPIAQIYFPLTAMVSLLVVLDDGLEIETAAVGHEGMVGLPVALGAEADGHRGVVQVPGEALLLEAGALREALAGLPSLQPLLLRYAQFCFVQAGTAAACNDRHAINERCARWLLEAHDRVHADRFPLTQHYLAAMLGVQRPSVTVAAGMLQQAGLITYQRGHITILDRERLEEASCECYRRIVTEYQRLLGHAW